MASAIVGALKVILSADTAAYSTAMARAGKEAAAFSKEFTSIGRQMSNIGAAMTKTITLPLVALGAGAVKAASDFESSFAGVRKTVEATEPEFAALAQGLRDMAKEIPVNVNELNKVAESAGQLGIKKNDILAFTRTMADLGVTTNLTADEAATATAQIQNIFGAAGKDVDRFGATLVALGNSGASTEKDIIAMGLRIAGAGHQIGMSQDQVMAFASALSSVGINAEAGGTTISRVFLKMNDAVMKGGAGLAEFARVAGMSAGQFKAAFERDAASAAVTFINGLDRLKQSGENVNVTIEGLMGKSILIKDTLMRASGAGQLLNDQLAIGAKAWKENTALTEEANKRYATFASQLAILWNQVRDVGIELGTAMLPALKSVVGMAQAAVPVLEMMVKLFTWMPGWVQGSAVALLALVAAAGPVIWTFGQISLAIGTVIGAFKAKGVATLALNKIMGSAIVTSGALRTAMAFLGPVVAVVATAFASWKLGGWLGEVSGATDMVGRLTTKLGEMIGLLPKGALAQYDAMRASLKSAESAKDQAKALDQTSDAYKSAGAAAANFVGPINELGGEFARTKEEIAEAKKAADDFAKSLRQFGGADAMAGAKDVIKQLHALNGPLNVLPSKLEEMAARLREGAQAALMMGKSDLANQYDKLADTLDPIIQFQQRYNVTLGEYITQAPTAASLTAELNDQLHRLGGTVETIGPTLKSSMDLSQLFVGFKGTIKENLPDSTQWAQAWGSMKEGLYATLAEVPGTLMRAFEGGGDVWGAVKSIGSRIGAGIGGSIGLYFGGPAGQALGQALGSMVGPAMEGIKKLFGFGINDAVKKANAEIDKSKKALIDMHGPLDVLDKKARAVGLSFQDAWGHQGQKGLEQFNALVAEFNKRWDELQAKREALEGDLKNTQGELDGLIGKARDLGYEFDSSGKFIGVTFDSVKAKADEFGVSVDGLGPKFRQQGIDAEAKRIIDAFTLLDKAAGPEGTGGILSGLKDEIGKLVADSIKFGTTIPANMKPWVDELMRTDQLVDENGLAITDLSGLKFGEPVATEFEKISSALMLVVEKLQAILDQIAAIPTDKTLNVVAKYSDPGPPEGFGDPEYHGYRSGDPGFATGTLGRLGKWFGSFPKAGFATALHGMEAVITPDQSVPFAMDVLAGMGGGGGGTVDFSSLTEEVRGLRSDIARRDALLPTLINIASKAQPGRRR